MSKGKKLEAWEALKIMQEGKLIIHGLDMDTYCLADFNNSFFEDFRLCDWYEYIEPEKPKNIAERFASEYSITNGGRWFIKDFYEWLKQQPENQEGE
jgi:hypothetical protein